VPTEDRGCRDKKFTTIILAAGAGKRMFSPVPKILHTILGKPIIEFVVDIAEDIGSAEIILVVGKKKSEVTGIIGSRAAYAVQPVPRGTGDATKIGLARARHDSVLILYGDVPCITRETLGAMMAFHDRRRAVLTVLTCVMGDPGRYGRIVRDRRGRFREIIEYSDADPVQMKIKEINSGIYFGQRQEMKRAVAALTDRNKQGEYYLTDIVKYLIAGKKTVAAYAITDEDDIHGVNSRSDMARVRGIIRERRLEELMQRGVYVEDPATTQIDLSVRIGEFVHIRPYTMLEGATVIADEAVVGPFVWIRDNRRMPLPGQKRRPRRRRL
jgi:bifunctional UDP-N-acetylglucosamine pyrophosphorylase/glucosamine-1-phosphate N-acetyltransferase